MLEMCVTMEINGDTFPAVIDDSSSVNYNLDDLECMFGAPLVTPPPTLEEVFDQNNEDGDLIGQTQEENKDDNGINLMG